jgi:SulP family sulfate permease
LDALEELVDQARRDGTTILLTGVNAQPMTALDRAGTLAKIGRGNVYPDIDAAITRARQLVGEAPERSVTPLDPRN